MAFHVRLLTDSRSGHIPVDDPLGNTSEEAAALALLHFKRIGTAFDLDSRLEVTSSDFPKDAVYRYTVREVVEWVRSENGQSFLSKPYEEDSKLGLEALANEMS
jgi:hypothetical protein